MQLPFVHALAKAGHDPSSPETAHFVLTSGQQDLSTKLRLTNAQVLTLTIAASRAIVGPTPVAIKARTRRSVLTTGCAVLDAALNGGLRRAQITEVFGESGAGKTQLALQLGVTCQWPIEHGGLAGGAVYILSESLFASTRYFQLASTLLPPNVLESDPTLYADNVHILHVRDPDTQFHILKYTLPALMEKHDIKLIVIDSVAATLRYGFSNDVDEPVVEVDDEQQQQQRKKQKTNGGSGSSDGSNGKRKPPSGMLGRHEKNTMVVQLAQTLKNLASRFDAVVVCINQVTAKISSSGNSSFSDMVSLVPIATGSEHGMEKAFVVDESRSKGTNANSSANGGMPGFSSDSEPSLGLLWSSCVNARICLSKSHFSGDFNLALDSEEVMRGGIRQLVSKRRMNVIFNPNGPSGGNGVECVISERGLVGI
ncbi:UNVERIFIED_CONTAM: hypothetical protein HDU68_005229 [Siphonaria sp. JEL0065]|nr:hypothetical protein HDU68_005229 [Siphonaria sp. JEL0065]